MSGKWAVQEQGKTGGVQYLRARLEQSASTAVQILGPGDASQIFNVSGYTQGFVSFESPGIAEVSLHGSVCTDVPGEFFEIKTENIIAGGAVDIIYTMPVKNIFIRVISGNIASNYITIFCAA